MSCQVVGIGEVLWDLFPDGPQLGGAPANFAYHAHALGARAIVLTRVGKDKFGSDILDRFKLLGLPLMTVQLDDHVPTGTVAVTLNGNGVPHFVIHENVAWDRLEKTSIALQTVRSADAVCFGSLAQRSEISRSTIIELLRETKPGALKVFDINLREKYYTCEVIEQSLKLANVLKLNDQELFILSKMFNLTGNNNQLIAALAEKFGLSVVALTMGPKGSMLYQKDRWSECPSRVVDVKDTVGAGDAFTASIVIGLLAKMDLDQIHFAASEIAQYVCTCVGATPPLPARLRELVVGRPTFGRVCETHSTAEI